MLAPITHPAAPADLRVFVVDEEERLCELLRIALEMEGWTVSTFGTGSAATAAIIEERPDGVLMDMMLPDMSGVEVVRSVRTAGNEAPVVFLTGRSEHEDRMEAYGAGADDYITKPFSLEEVVVRLRGLLPAVP